MSTDKSTAHTPEPWSIRPSGNANEITILDATGHWLMHFLHNGEPHAETQKANARRIVACVNELAGVENPTGYVHRLEQQRDELLAEACRARNLIEYGRTEAALNCLIDAIDHTKGATP